MLLRENGISTYIFNDILSHITYIAINIIFSISKSEFLIIFHQNRIQLS